jgi:hypothetical protein
MMVGRGSRVATAAFQGLWRRNDDWYLGPMRPPSRFYDVAIPTGSSFEFRRSPVPQNEGAMPGVTRR